MINLLCDELDLHWEFLNRFTFHRIGNDGTRILMTALDSLDRRELFIRAKTLKVRNLFVNDNLTKDRAQFFFELRMMRKSKEIYSVNSYNGELYVKINEKSPRILARNMDQIKNEIRKGIDAQSEPIETTQQ